ncbi:sigma-70 family RNA polymerase sigma factor [Sphingobium xenophagum]|uniref:sigma-70 family RNA polymerase sigma factor n=1 Tax=Sphingobium xenophagum TaxID=121428 RepID=UPI000B3C2C36|nr:MULTISPECIES: sigma-70 family RNA polymerase sigma factor [Sphingomonadaceae]
MFPARGLRVFEDVALKSEPIALSLYKSHRESLISYAGRLSGDPVVAEDIVQDAWLLLDRQPASKPIREPLGYLKRIVRNLVFAQARRSRYEGQIIGGDMTAAVAQLPDEAPSAEAELIARDDLRLVMDLVDALPERQIAAFKMYHFEGMKLREVATRLGISTSLAHLLVTEAMQLCDERRKRGME